MSKNRPKVGIFFKFFFSLNMPEACYEESIVDDLFIVPINAINLLIVFYLSAKIIWHSWNNTKVHRFIKILFFCFAKL